MKLKLLVLPIAIAFAVSCKPDNPPGPGPDDDGTEPTPDDPQPQPEPDPQPEPQPTPEPITCLGSPLGTIKEVPCDTGYEGKLVKVCSNEAKWVVVSNQCFKPVPKPIDPVQVSLPEAYRINAGESVALGVKSQKDVTFSWSTGETGEQIWVTPDATKSFTITATRKDGSKATASVTVIVQ